MAGELRNRGLGSARIFVFDACGAGDSFIISTAAEGLLKKESGSGADKTRNLVLSLRNRALETARALGLETVFLLPTPFSDDAGFLSAGLPAQTITILPTPEASALAVLLRKSPRMAGALINRRIRDTQRGYSIPETWRRLNGPEDTPEHLTPENYKYLIRFALALCRQ